MMCEYSGKLTEALVLARTRATELEKVRKLNCWESELSDSWRLEIADLGLKALCALKREYVYSTKTLCLSAHSSFNMESVIARSQTITDVADSLKTELYMGSDVTDISIVRKMPNLEVCSLSVNGIPTLKDFSYCPNLQEVYIRKNAIEDLSEICHLRSLPKLRSLWLADNPCCSRENYRSTVLKTLPNLQKLDNIAVTEDELNAAVEEGDDLTLEQPPKSRSQDSAKDSNSFTESISDENSASSNANTEKNSRLDEVVTLTMEETNQIRAQLGLKPLPVDKMTPPKSVASGTTKSRNSHILNAILLLIKELDSESLEVVGNAVNNRRESL